MSRDLARASELIATTKSQGWRSVVEIAEELIREAEVAALDCEDEAKIVDLQRRAQAARKHWNLLLTRLQTASNPTAAADEQFQTVSY